MLVSLGSCFRTLATRRLNHIKRVNAGGADEGMPAPRLRGFVNFSVHLRGRTKAYSQRPSRVPSGRTVTHTPTSSVHTFLSPPVSNLAFDGLWDRFMKDKECECALWYRPTDWGRGHLASL